MHIVLAILFIHIMVHMPFVSRNEVAVRIDVGLQPLGLPWLSDPTVFSVYTCEGSDESLIEFGNDQASLIHMFDFQVIDLIQRDYEYMQEGTKDRTRHQTQ
jgi:hypothetical protein